MTKLPHLTLPWWLLLAASTSALPPTYPSPPTDHLEDLMHLLTGHAALSFARPLSLTTPTRLPAAEYLRTAFHDAASANTVLGTGGLDASIAYETTRLENAGPAFNATLAALAPYLGPRSSAADLLALGVYAAVRSSGGPGIGVRGGRVDARAAGMVGGVPVAQNSVGTFGLQFERMGFSREEMVGLVACGHSLGGVHEEVSPEMVEVGAGMVAFDGTRDLYDNRVVTEYLGNATGNALVGGKARTNGRDSDARVFAADGNVTMRALADAETYRSTCADLLQRMVEVVPAGVTLSEVIEVYEVKPSGLQLTLLGGGETIRFAGEIRVRTTQRAASDIAGVKLVYKDRDGAESCGECSLGTEASGSAAGFDDSFEFYAFSADLPSDSSISTFNVLITLTSGETELYDNNGNGFPVQDSIIFQSPQSCLSGSDMTIVAAVRNTEPAPSLNITLKVPAPRSVLPVLEAVTIAMTQQSSISPYDLYTATHTLTSAQLPDTHFDVTLGTAADSFKSTADLSTTCQDLSPDPPAASSSSSTVAPTSAVPSSSTMPTSSTIPPSSTTPTSSTTPSSSSTPPSSTTTPPTTQPTLLACPAADTATWTLATGDAFNIQCDKDYQAGQIGVVGAASFEACLEACVAAEGCRAVAYTGGLAGGDCYLKNLRDGAVDVEGVWGAVRVG